MPTYINGANIKAVKTQYGTILKLNINAQKFCDEINKHKNEKGYVTFDITEKKEADQFGNTHKMTLNEFKPEPKKKDEPIEEKEDLPF